MLKKRREFSCSRIGVAGSRNVFQVLWESPRLLFWKTKSFPKLREERSASSAVAVGECWMHLWRRRIYSRALKEGNRWWQVGGRPSASISAPSYPGNCRGEGGRRTAKSWHYSLRLLEVSPKLCPTLTHHLERPGCPQKNNKVGVGGGLGSSFPISASSLHYQKLNQGF